MYWISFGRWNHKGGRWLSWTRVHWGWHWTPFVKVERRYKRRSKP